MNLRIVNDVHFFRLIVKQKVYNYPGREKNRKICKISVEKLWWNYIISPLKKFQKDVWLFVGKLSVRPLVNVS